MKTRTPDGFGRRTGEDLHAGARLTAMQESLLWVPRGQHGMHAGGCEEQLRLGDVNGRAHARNRRILRNEKKYWEVYSAFKRTRSASSRTEEGAWRAARAGRAAPPSDSTMAEGSRTTWRWRRYAEIINMLHGQEVGWKHLWRTWLGACSVSRPRTPEGCSGGGFRDRQGRQTGRVPYSCRRRSRGDIM